jgi:uncharacterized membrane protein
MDVAAGVAVAVISYTISYFIKNIWINVFQYSLLCGLIVGFMLWSVTGIPFWFNLATITISTLITTVIGALLFKSIIHRILPENK